MSITINHQTNALTATSGNITVNGSVPGPALVSGTTIKTVNSVSILGSGDLVTGDVTLAGTQTLTNKTIAYNSNTLTGVQPTLVSGTNIKTVNGTPLLGGGDITISGGGGAITYTATASSASWIGTGPFTQTLTVTGLSAANMVILDLDLSAAAFGSIAALQTAYALIYRATPFTNQLVLYATEAPATSFDLYVRVI